MSNMIILGVYHRWPWQVNLAVRKKEESWHVSYTSKEWVTWYEVQAYISLTISLGFFTSRYILNCDKNIHTSISNQISWMLSLVLFSTIYIFFSEYISWFFLVSIFFSFWWLIYLLAPVTFSSSITQIIMIYNLNLQKCQKKTP